MKSSDLLGILVIFFAAILCFYYGKQYVLSQQILRDRSPNNTDTLRYGVWKIMRNACTYVIPGGAAMEQQLANHLPK